MSAGITFDIDLEFTCNEKQQLNIVDENFCRKHLLQVIRWNCYNILFIWLQGAIVLVLWYGGKLVNDHSMNVGELTCKKCLF